MDDPTHLDENKYESLKIYFDDVHFNALNMYEKERLSNFQRNYDIFKSRLNPKLPQFVQQRKKLEISRSRNTFTIKEFEVNTLKEELSEEAFDLKSGIKIEDESVSPEWNTKRAKKWKEMLEMDWGDPIVEVTSKARRFFSFYLERAKKCLEFIDKIDTTSDENSHKTMDIKPPKTRDRDLNTERVRSSVEFMDDTNASTSYYRHETSDIKPPKSELNTDVFSSRDSKPQQRYPKRNIPKICYTEEEISSDDELLFCEECEKEFKEECPVHGRLVHLLDKKVPRGSDPNRAKLTCPSFLSIGRSSIKGAGLGVWTEVTLKKGIVFGPYEGQIVKSQKVAQISGYAWELRRRGRILNYVDGYDTSVSTWLRFVNCAPCEERQNLKAFQYNGNIYYKTYKVVPAFAELLVWYGDEYGEDLGIVNGDDSDPNYSPTGDCNENSSETSYIQNIRRMNLHSVKARKIGKPLGSGYPKIRSNSGNQKSSDVDQPSQIANFTDPKKNAIQLQDEDTGLSVRAERKKGGQKRYSCLQCEYTAEHMYSVRGHTKTVHEKVRPHKCPHCEYRATYFSSIRNHVQAVHEELRPHKCPHCEYRTTRSTHLRIHIRAIHEGLRAHKCPHCEYSAVYTLALRNHVRTVHEELRPHKCPNCEYRASISVLLRRHVRAVHEGLRPYKCSHCEYRASQSTNLRVHVQKYHGGLKPH